ncbi:hypothetical protein N657DRAFT_680958 [Parathielavia appendiculata]|uniref:Uncharacterized protein n=1 Tax=Parathielavia appendiculata TaxID=2587402 RepID=A0AAN6U0B2_9PEZI|nr:hypothetical protein N657DRAFT_680958 [Parathielavia appendiculata]
MNLCITNSYGTLRPANDLVGGCQQGEGLITDPEPPTSCNTCMCRTGNGQEEESSSLNLNPFVENLDGYLWCFGHRSEQL